jgi:hypothetical protein
LAEELIDEFEERQSKNPKWPRRGTGGIPPLLNRENKGTELISILADKRVEGIEHYNEKGPNGFDEKISLENYYCNAKRCFNFIWDKIIF